MSNPIVNLNVRANTARAMADFKKFSDSLNNKFLVSGLKVDLITSTLKQINNEFQKSIGEQGLLGASSIRAAQNQAALLTSTFKGFGLEASKSINANMTKALSDVAVRAGGTMADIKKTMGAVPFISANLTNEDRTNLARQILSFQRDLRRSGVSEEGATIGQKFLSGQTNVQDMLNSQDPITAKMGMTLANKGAQLGTIFNAQMRTEYLKELMNDPELKGFLAEQAKQTSGFKLYIEDLNTKLFNPESGLFGALRKVKMSATRTTTIFDETDRIIKSVFGPQGIFIKFFQKVAASFNINEPLKFIIMGMDFLGRQINALSSFIDSPKFQEITEFVKKIFDDTWNVFKNIYDQVVGGSLNSAQIVEDIKGTGTSIREFIRNIGSTIRGENIDKEVDFGTSIVSTLAEETGKTVVTLIQEIFKVFIDKAPGIAAKALPAMSKAFNNVMIQMFGGLAEPIKMLMGFIPGPLGMVARTANMTSKVGADNPWSLAAVGAAAFAPSLIGLGKRGAGVFRGGIRANRRYIDRKLSTGPNIWQEGVGFTGINDGVITRPRTWGRGGRLMGDSNLVGARNSSLLDRDYARRVDQFLEGRRETGILYDADRAGGGFTSRLDPNHFPSPQPQDLSALQRHDAALQAEWQNDPLSQPRQYNRHGDLGDRYRRRYNRGPRFGRFVRKNKFGLIAAGVAALGTAAIMFPRKAGAATMDEMSNVNAQRTEKISGGVNAFGEMAGGAMNGAGMGATAGGLIGSIFPGIGNALGAAIGGAIGGVIGGLIPLLNKETRQSIIDFGIGIKSWAGDFLTTIGSAFKNTWSSMSNGLSNFGRGLTQGLMDNVHKITDIFKIFDRKQSGDATESDESFFGRLSSIGKSIQIDKPFFGLLNRYNGLNDSGSALAMEARMSGNRSFITPGGNIANSGEIIIPSGSIGTLAYILEAKMANRSGSGGGTPTIIKLDININNPVMLGDNEELIASLRDPVLDIVNDAYKSVANNRIRSTVIS